MPAVFLDGMNFAGSSWTFKLVQNKQPDASTWHAKALYFRNNRTIC